MKFSLSVDSLSKENQFLRLLAKILFSLVFVLIAQAIFLYNRDLILIQSSTRGFEIIKPISFKHSELDLKYAIELMLKARFNTQTFNANLYLSEKQKALRLTEQLELKNKGMNQTIVVREIKNSKDEATVEIDRIISFADLRSAFRTKLKISFEESEPNELNPYGLVLSLAEVEKSEVKK